MLWRCCCCCCCCWGSVVGFVVVVGVVLLVLCCCCWWCFCCGVVVVFVVVVVVTFYPPPKLQPPSTNLIPNYQPTLPNKPQLNSTPPTRILIFNPIFQPNPTTHPHPSPSDSSPHIPSLTLFFTPHPPFHPLLHPPPTPPPLSSPLTHHSTPFFTPTRPATPHPPLHPPPTTPPLSSPPPTPPPPRYLTSHKPSLYQPKLGRGRGEMGEGEVVLVDAFTNEEWVETFVKLLTIQEEKEKNRFCIKHFLLFKVSLGVTS